MNEMIAQIATVAATAAVHTILVEREDGNRDELTRCRSINTGVRPRLGRPSPSYTFSNKVKSIYVFHTHRVDKAEINHNVRNPLDRQALVQAEQEEDKETVKFLQFCKLKQHKSENMEEWI